MFLKRVVEVLDGAPPKPEQNARGQSLVEMTLILPILLIIIMGVVEVGWYAQNILTLTEAVRVGARRAPFLNGDFSPLSWDEAATYPPAATTPNTDPRVLVRGGPEELADCRQIRDTDFGFFNTIACATLDAMEPLTLDQENNKDDLVISAFSLQRVRIGGNSNDDINPADFGSSTTYTNGSQLIVVARYPHSANECSGWNERDPFDWLTNGSVDYTTTPRNSYEVAVWDEALGRYVGFADANTAEEHVGFSWTGQWNYVDASGTRTSCFGSQWKIEDIEERANLPGFLGSEDERQYLPSVGLVLVEIFFEHRLLFENFPAMSAQWSPLYQMMGGDDPMTVADVIRAWALFPAPAAEPRLVFRP
jgi:hypothetical protein